MKGSAFHSTLLKTKIIITVSIIVFVKTKPKKYIFVRKSFLSHIADIFVAGRRRARPCLFLTCYVARLLEWRISVTYFQVQLYNKVRGSSR